MLIRFVVLPFMQLIMKDHMYQCFTISFEILFSHLLYCIAVTVLSLSIIPLSFLLSL